ncbi:MULTISPECIES: replicative DNA helicase [Pseudomonas]|uniref:replicative DNA helicase n=1 Tax=Pseudomonas TaxID=286 RepID=UPI0004A71313|nr:MULTISPECIES: DnaB-like helicase C-terminal domain-containing protein [Pseudomonas]MDH1551201.1 AAA family ATPase [Pseudomonas juntendi]MRT60425.1 AAA family ATPase [Pseudomonas sp. CAH-1]QEQ87156.1 AAA family ATPase [Pseudomonas putida]
MRELFSIEAEHALLGALLLDANLFDEITSKLTTEDFSDLENAALYQAIRNTHDAGHAVDAVTVGTRYPTLPSGEGTIFYAGTIAKNTPSTANWKSYLNTVLERSTLRRVVEVAEVIRGSAHDDKPVEEIIALAQQATADLRNLDSGEPEYYRISEVLPAVIDGIDARFNGAVSRGLTTGLDDLDAILCGLRPGHMIVVAGLPGSGKTILGLQIAQHVTTRHGHSGLVFSMEMTKEELTARGIASLGGVSLSRLDTGTTLQDDDWPRITSAVGLLGKARLFVNDQPGMTMARIRSIARQCQKREGLDVLVVDYLTLIASEGGQNRALEVGRISTALKNLAKELGVPVIVLAQLNRGPANRPDKRPRPSDLRDSGQIEQDADAVILVHRDTDSEEGENGVTELIVGKCRHGKPGTCLVQAMGQFVRFVPFQGRPASDEEVEMGRSTYAQRYKGADL